MKPIRRRYPYSNKNIYDVVIQARSAVCGHYTHVTMFGPSTTREQQRTVLHYLKTHPCPRCEAEILIQN